MKYHIIKEKEELQIIAVLAAKDEVFLCHYAYKITVSGQTIRETLDRYPSAETNRPAAYILDTLAMLKALSISFFG